MKCASKNSKSFNCESCDFSTSKKNEWDRHILTRKHIDRTKIEQNGTECASKLKYVCKKCNKNYLARNSLWYHEKKCNLEKIPIVTNEIITVNENPSDEPSLKEIIIKVVEQNQAILLENQEMRKLLQETIPKIGNTTNNTTNNTNTNNFNLNFFLNEQCKDALNIMDFINQLQLKLSDLDMVGKVGYSEGISKIFIRGLKELDVFKRPIHCSDLKREVLYVKDQDSWEKDNEEKKKLKTAIKHIAAKNFKQIHDWQEENPESDDYDSKKHMDYHNIVINSMGGSNEEEDERNYNKIIKNLAKEVVIEKK
jgi:regulator of replication initiation timing